MRVALAMPREGSDAFSNALQEGRVQLRIHRKVATEERQRGVLAVRAWWLMMASVSFPLYLANSRF